MPNTANLQMPLLQQSQAQKHVTVNEALSVLDSIAQLTLESMTTSAPPSAGVEGQGFAVPVGATGDWAGAEGAIAIFSNAGWRFVAPMAGWKAYVKDEARAYLFDGAEWQGDAVATSPNGARLSLEVLEQDHTVSSGANNTTGVIIPAYSVVFGVTGRVIQTLTGSLDTWQLGVADSTARYGSGLKTAAGDWAFGLTGQPITYYAETPLVLSADGGTFGGGTVRLAVHLLRFGVPRM